MNLGTSPAFSNTTQSYFGRTIEENKIALSRLEKDLGSVNVLYVGVGVLERQGGNGSFGRKGYCGTGPIELAALLENLDRDYRMTILDNDEKIISAIKDLETISVEFSLGTGYRRADFHAFQEYLKMTGQKNSWENRLREKFAKNRANLKAKTPKTFSNKRQSGEINFIHGDITSEDLSKYGPFDFVHFTNVLCHMNGREIRASFDNIFKNLVEGGILLSEELRVKDMYDGGNILLPIKEVRETFEEEGIIESEMLGERYLISRKIK